MAGSNAEVTVDLKGKKIFVSECIKVTAGITLGVKQLSANYHRAGSAIK